LLFHSFRITAFFAPGGETGGKKAGFSMTKSDILIVLTLCYNSEGKTYNILENGEQMNEIIP
jgi:hypothetical protein